MANKKFKRNGVLVLESIFGDLMLTDPTQKVDVVLNSSFLENAKDDDVKLKSIGRMFCDFILSHRDRREKAMYKKVCNLEDEDFKKRMLRYLEQGTVSSLRKVEKDVYFYTKENNIS